MAEAVTFSISVISSSPSLTPYNSTLLLSRTIICLVWQGNEISITIKLIFALKANRRLLAGVCQCKWPELQLDLSCQWYLIYVPSRQTRHNNRFPGRHGYSLDIVSPLKGCHQRSVCLQTSIRGGTACALRTAPSDSSCLIDWNNEHSFFSFAGIRMFLIRRNTKSRTGKNTAIVYPSSIEDKWLFASKTQESSKFWNQVLKLECKCALINSAITHIQGGTVPTQPRKTTITSSLESQWQ